MRALNPSTAEVSKSIVGNSYLGITSKSLVFLVRWQADIDERIATETWQPSNYRDAYTVNVHEINSGVIYKDANVTVTAFPTKHAFPETYGYRFDTADRSIVNLRQHHVFPGHHRCMPRL